MSMPVNVITLAVMAAVGIGMGLYYLLNDSTEEEPLRHGSRRPANTSTRVRESSPPRPWSTRPRQHVPTSNVTRQSPRSETASLPQSSRCQTPSSPCPRVPLPSSKKALFRRRKLMKNCEICATSMPHSTIDLNCGHIFHSECYTIWKNIMESFNINKICPQCSDLTTKSL